MKAAAPEDFALYSLWPAATIAGSSANVFAPIPGPIKRQTTLLSTADGN